MSIWSTLFGSSEVVSKGLELIDDAFTSEPELIEAKTKAKTDMLAAYAPFKVAQRYLALIFAMAFISSYLLVMGMTLAGADVDGVRAVIDEFSIDWIMLTIVAFYFGGGAFEGVKNAAPKR